MHQKRLLIATTHQGKLTEIQHAFQDLPFEVLSLNDLKESYIDPEETEPTLFGNATLKAHYYGEKTGMLTLADDTGLFVDALHGWPGVKSARIKEDGKSLPETLLDQLRGVAPEKRTAYFETKIAVYDPHDQSTFVATGKTEGTILDALVTEDIIHSYGYNTIFFHPPSGTTFAQMPHAMKNEHSQRGKALIRAKYYLNNTYSATQFFVPLALLIRDGKILMNKRHDPHNPKWHHKWEFPGGGVEFGETIEENIVREVKEETGFDVAVVQSVGDMMIDNQSHRQKDVQVFLLPHICRISGGSLEPNDEEVVESIWVTPQEVCDYDLIGANKRLFTSILPAVEEYINTNN